MEKVDDSIYSNPPPSLIPPLLLFAFPSYQHEYLIYPSITFRTPIPYSLSIQPSSPSLFSSFLSLQHVHTLPLYAPRAVLLRPETALFMYEI